MSTLVKLTLSYFYFIFFVKFSLFFNLNKFSFESLILIFFLVVKWSAMMHRYDTCIGYDTYPIRRYVYF